LHCSACRSASQRLRGDVDNLITQCANDMWSAWTTTNTSLQQRVTESQDAHNKLQSHMAKTMQEIYDQEKHIQALKKAIRDKEAPLKARET
jgi:peptidoglycan hydrolase CwlO-like protein